MRAGLTHRCLRCAAARAGSERLIGKTSSSSLQDLLRLLTLWFNYGAAPDVEAALQEGFSHVSIDTWLAVIPQACGQASNSCVLPWTTLRLHMQLACLRPAQCGHRSAVPR